ncbi:MAG: hypothetical protein GWP14_03655 [Actinobacteria bacterium]|nr:hypothetical protein [Actinomycetota bacterium]
MTKILLLTSVIAASLLCSGCISAITTPNASKLNKVELGMTKAEVIEQMGKPDSIRAQGNTEYLVYRLATEKDYSMAWYFGMTFVHKDDYFARLVDGKVDAYGRFGDFDSTKDPKLQIDLDANIKSE